MSRKKNTVEALDLNLGQEKEKKIRLTAMLTPETSSNLDEFLKEMEPPTRFDGEPKKNFKSIVVDAILRNFFSKKHK